MEDHTNRALIIVMIVILIIIAILIFAPHQIEYTTPGTIVEPTHVIQTNMPVQTRVYTIPGTSSSYQEETTTTTQNTSTVPQQ